MSIYLWCDGWSLWVVVGGGGSSYPVEVVDDVCGVAAAEAGRGHADLLVVVVQVDAQVLLHLLAAPQRGEDGVLVDHPAVEQAVLRHLLRRPNQKT